MNLTVPFLGLLLSIAHSLEITEDEFNNLTSQLRKVSQELQEYKVKFRDIRQKLIKAVVLKGRVVTLSSQYRILWL